MTKASRAEPKLRRIAKELRLQGHKYADPVDLGDPLNQPDLKLEPAQHGGSAHRLAAEAAASRAKEALRIRLRVLHNSVKSPPAPCASCTSSACCHSFLVQLSKEEFDSGLYGRFAIELSEEAAVQLSTSVLFVNPTIRAVLGAGHRYFLEGEVGQACPFLKPGGCGIYEHRPVVCRAYTCDGDARITEEMRKASQEEMTDLVTSRLSFGI